MFRRSSCRAHRLFVRLLAASTVLALAVQAGAQQGACQTTLAHVVLRAGSFVRTADLSESPGIRLQSVGGASGGAAYSIWRIVNGDAAERDVLLSAAGVPNLTKLRLPGRTETYLRSEFFGEHSLFAGTRRAASSAPRSTPWSDTRVVADPLCGEPSLALWIARERSLTRVSAVDAGVLVDVPLREDPGAIAVDPIQGNVWRYRRGILQAYDSRGRPLVSVRSIAEPARLDNDTRHLAVDSEAGEVWIVLDRFIYRVGFDGTLLGQVSLQDRARSIAFDAATRTLWVGTSAGLSGVQAADAASGSQSGSPGIAAGPQLVLSGGVRALALDPSSSEIWAAGGGAIRRIDARGQVTLDARAGAFAADVRFLAADRSGGVWAAGGKGLLHVDIRGTVDWRTPPVELLAGEITGLFFDPQTDSVWLATAGFLLHYARDGRGHPLLRPIPLAAYTPAVGLEPLAARAIRALGAFVDDEPPIVDIVSPAQDAVLATARPQLRIAHADAAGRVDPESTEALVNGRPIGVSCRNDSDFLAVCEFEQDLPTGTIELAVTVSDDAGNRSAPASRRFRIAIAPPDTQPVITITSPADGSIVRDRAASIIGHVSTSGAATGVTTPVLQINGQAVPLVPVDGHFAFAYLAALEPGENLVALDVRAAGGMHAERKIRLHRDGESPFSVSALSSEAIAQSAVTFDVAQLGPTPVASISLDLDGDGIPERTFQPSAEPIRVTFDTPGVHVVAAQLRTAQGERFDYTVPVVVGSPDEIDREIRNEWSSMVAELLRGNTQAALSWLTADAQDRYREVFESLRTALPAIVGELSPLRRFRIAGNFADYVVAREVSGVQRAFVVTFVRDGDRRWRILAL